MAREDGDEVLLPLDGSEDEDAPQDLPEAKETPEPGTGKFIPDACRICPQCKSGDNVRIVSNLSGRQAYCGPCKIDWPIGPPVVAIALPIMGRNATGKRSVQEPDWNLAYEDVDPIGPK